MAGLEIHLLGTPRLVLDGAPVPGPRGAKAWGLLAYLLRTERAPARDELLTLLFDRAEDPLAALRWNLSALRRALPGAHLAGDPIVLELPPGTSVDVRTVASGSWPEALDVPGLAEGLLAGLDFSATPAFDLWATAERRHLDAIAEGVLREAAFARLAAGDATGAVVIAGRLVRLAPLDEDAHVLLVRALAASGDAEGAVRQVQRCRALLQDRLGLEPSPALQAATYARRTGAGTTGSSAAAARAQLEAGQAAIAAGALDAGLDCLRRAADGAAAAGAPDVRAAALLALGTALVHAARGQDEEAVSALHAVLELPGDEVRPLAAAAARELGFVEVLGARYERAERWLRRALELAGDDPGVRGPALAVLGEVATDQGHYRTALDLLRASRATAEAAGDARGVAYALSCTGRAHVLRRELDAAVQVLDEALTVARADRWTSFSPWPLALRAEAALEHGDVDGAAGRLEHAFALGCQLADPCWETVSARGLGRVAAARGDVDEAVRWFGEARRRSARLPGAYRWGDAWALDALCQVAIDHGLPSARGWCDELAELAGRTGMRELLARSYVHRARLGEREALVAAGAVAGDVDNPALHALVDAAGALAVRS